MSGFKTMMSGRKAREEILEGVETLASAVSSTMGPRGKNVIIEQPGGPPHLTKDGVTVAKCINLRDKYKNLGVQVVKEAASRTADTAGDGTTTATVLCHAIYSEGLKMINSSFQPSEIVKGINDAKDVIIEELQTMARPLECDEEIIQVETNPEAPYSVNLWIVNIDNTPHIFSGDNLSQWAKNILKNDEVRLKIGENIYPLRATRVVETERFEQFARGWDEKYGHRPLNENPTETYLFQLN